MSGEPKGIDITAGGRYVVFVSWASNLVENDTNDAGDIFVHDRTTGTTTLISRATDGSIGNGNSGSPSISSDGRFVAFASGASNLVANDTNSAQDIFVHDRTTSETFLISMASDGTQGNRSSSWLDISADGRYVAFVSDASNLVANDTNDTEDVFVHDRTLGETTRVSVTSDGTQATFYSTNPSISADGRYVAFQSYSKLVPSIYFGDRVYVHDQITGETTLVSLASDGTHSNDQAYAPSISADGRYVAFESSANNLVENDANASRDIFVHDRTLGETVRISVATDGTEGDFGSSWSNISGDGRYVAFSSEASNLVTNDTNGTNDVFVYDRDWNADTSQLIYLPFIVKP